MPRSRRALNAAAAEGAEPPSTLPPHQIIARVAKPAGTNLFAVTFPPSTASTSTNPSSGHSSSSPSPTQPSQAELPNQTSQSNLVERLVEMPARFRSAIYVRRGGFVLVDTAAFEGRENKLAGEIAAVISNEKEWRKMGYWPGCFARRVEESDSEDEGRGRGMPGSDEEEEDEEGEEG